MAKYTVELKDIVRSGYKLFDFQYPFYDESKREEFQQLFIDYFYFREIGTETVGRFQHYLKSKFLVSLPYYNELLETSIYEYDLKNNYILTETFTKTNSNNKTATGEAAQNGTTTDKQTGSGSLNRQNDVTATTDKTNALDSTTDHTEKSNTKKDDKYKDTFIVNNKVTVEEDNRKVESDTPNGLLNIRSIESETYASRANFDSNTTKNFIVSDEQMSKTNSNDEESTGTTKDTVKASTTDRGTDTNKEKGSEETTSTNNSNGSFSNNANTLQNENESGTENYTLKREGDIGVDTTPDKLKKHIELQKILTTVYQQFFDHCEDLFMQIY